MRAWHGPGRGSGERASRRSGKPVSFFVSRAPREAAASMWVSDWLLPRMRFLQSATAPLSSAVLFSLSACTDVLPPPCRVRATARRRSSTRCTLEPSRPRRSTPLRRVIPALCAARDMSALVFGACLQPLPAARRRRGPRYAYGIAPRTGLRLNALLHGPSRSGISFEFGI